MNLRTCYVEDHGDGSFEIYKATSMRPHTIHKGHRPCVIYACKDPATAFELSQILVDRLTYMSDRKFDVYVEVAAVLPVAKSNHGFGGSHELSYVDSYQDEGE